MKKLLTTAAVSVLLIGLTMSGTAYSQVPQIEREALIALYNSTDGGLLFSTDSSYEFGEWLCLKQLF